jgi:tight adherence protein B
VLVVTDVAARLRAGAAPDAAWEGALGRRTGPDGPTVDDLVAGDGDRAQAAVVVAAGRLARDLGTPLAPLLDLVVHQLVAQAEAEGERRAALAGPRATARVLTWLPVLGVLLGTALGADPVAVLLDGALGTGALLAGLALLAVGRAWTARLARVAAAAGRPT